MFHLETAGAQGQCQHAVRFLAAKHQGG